MKHVVELVLALVFIGCSEHTVIDSLALEPSGGAPADTADAGETLPGTSGAGGAGAGDAGEAEVGANVALCDSAACDDGIECTIEECVPETGQCLRDASACACATDDDCALGRPACVVSTCNTLTRTCETDSSACPCDANTPDTVCNDNDLCTLDACVDFACENTATAGLVCDDLRSCSTGDSCGADGACTGDVSNCPPAAWSCEEALYGNGACDCGCGAVDRDCTGPEVELCVVCQCPTCSDHAGACANGFCPVEPTNNASCGWICPGYLYGEGTCDCGCGVVDRDCDSAAADECDFSYCNPFENGGDPVDPNYNGLCTDPPPVAPGGWTCSAYFFGDGGCDCGCGVLDSDCDGDATIDACSFCACSNVDLEDCPVDPADNTVCTG